MENSGLKLCGFHFKAGFFFGEDDCYKVGSFLKNDESEMKGCLGAYIHNKPIA